MAATARILLFHGQSAHWTELVSALRAEGRHLELTAPAAEPADVAARARQGNTVVVVDVSANPLLGLETVSACRRLAPAAPVIAVAADLSVELARSIRAAGVFYLALQPIAIDELRTALDNAQASLAKRRPSASACTTKARVLVVDDDADFVRAVTALLESEGYAVTQARSGREGLEAVAAQRPDLLILDIMMEDAWSGYVVNQAVKYQDGYAQVRDMPVLMVSSVQLDPAARFAGASEAPMVTPDAYLTKPLDSRELLAVVAHLLGRSRPSPDS